MDIYDENDEADWEKPPVEPVVAEKHGFQPWKSYGVPFLCPEGLGKLLLEAQKRVKRGFRSGIEAMARREEWYVMGKPIFEVTEGTVCNGGMEKMQLSFTKEGEAWLKSEIRSAVHYAMVDLNEDKQTITKVRELLDGEEG